MKAKADVEGMIGVKKKSFNKRKWKEIMSLNSFQR
jgi:hypothetical protein